MAKDMIYQANPLIEGRREFSLIEFRLFYIGLKDIFPRLTMEGIPKNSKSCFPTTIIHTEDLIKIFGNDKYYSTLEDICKNMAKKTVEVRRDDEWGFSVYPLFAELSYTPKKGLRLEFNEKMLPWLKDLANKSFTRIPFDQVWGLSSPYSMRLLELLLQYQNLPRTPKNRTLTVEQIRKCLNVPEDAYRDRMDNFKRFIIDAPVKDINEKTSYKVEYTPIKEKRRIVAFKFSLYLPEDIKRVKRREEIEALKQMPDIEPEAKPNHESQHETDAQEKQEVKAAREMPAGMKAGLARLREELADNR